MPELNDETNLSMGLYHLLSIYHWNVLISCVVLGIQCLWTSNVYRYMMGNFSDFADMQ